MTPNWVPLYYSYSMTARTCLMWQVTCINGHVCYSENYTPMKFRGTYAYIMYKKHSDGTYYMIPTLLNDNGHWDRLTHHPNIYVWLNSYVQYSICWHIPTYFSHTMERQLYPEVCFVLGELYRGAWWWHHLDAERENCNLLNKDIKFIIPASFEIYMLSIEWIFSELLSQMIY